MIQVKKVETSAELRQFIDLPHELYANDKNYVPELYVGVKALLNRKENPFFQHSEADWFLAYKDNKIVGRIAAIKNNNYNAFVEDNSIGFFGFFETIEDYEVARHLFDTAVSWMKSHGLSTIIGPENFSTNDTCGMLIDGYNTPPYAMMTHNPPFYNLFAEKYGFVKKMDLLAYLLKKETISTKAINLAGKVEERLKKSNIIVRQIDMKRFDEEVEMIRTVYNSAWEKNWGFVPMTDAEFRHLAKDLKQIVNPAFTLIAEHDGKMIGYSLAIPNVNEIFIKIKRGRLFPTGLLKLLWNKNKIKTIRVITLGICEPYRKMGIEVCFYARTMDQAMKQGIHSAEASWILENNTMMNQALINIKAEVHKKYRLYEYKIQ